MTRDQVIKLAREAGAGDPESLFGRTDYVAMTKHEIERFAALVAAAEREECAKVVEIFDRTFQTGGGIAGAIRARGIK